MAVLSKPITEPKSELSLIPVIDISNPESKYALVKACEDFGFFKVINHGVSTELVSVLEHETVEFFSLPKSEKTQVAGYPFGYGSRTIGRNGDVGWVEYLLMNANLDSGSAPLFPGLSQNPATFRNVLEEYITSVRKMTCHVLEMITDGLGIKQTNTLSKLVSDQNTDSILRLNHYPPCPLIKKKTNGGKNVIGFGEHTDPQIISVLRSNNTCGLQINLADGSWISVPPDHSSFFFNVGDSLQVMTNGRFKSVRHRVLANCKKSRVSMIYFAGPSLTQRIAPLTCLMDKEDEMLYEEFTWSEYRSSAYNSRLSDNRLQQFERKTINHNKLLLKI
ncbi:PREDICTED: gibberellin 2-beta-dioxygenase 1 [Camelina sativa]|uniref:Gibberellin 2-beta-dioxygenase 1 n=1 Tax=Camelina sativa TaxID=90675 RepID=A0ABM0TNL0_CAMSA|nr:PREDICTED: gibberellin 2-beta-dioxygenase 1 [Camelina sativa]